MYGVFRSICFGLFQISLSSEIHFSFEEKSKQLMTVFSWSQFMLFSLKCKWGVFRVYLGLLRTERRNLFGIMKFDSSKFMLKAGPFWHRTSSRIMFWRLSSFSNRMFHYKDWYCTLRFFLWWNISREFHVGSFFLYSQKNSSRQVQKCVKVEALSILEFLSSYLL